MLNSVNENAANLKKKLKKAVRDCNLHQVHATLHAHNGSRDVIDHVNMIHHMPFPAGGPLQPSMYL